MRGINVSMSLLQFLYDWKRWISAIFARIFCFTNIHINLCRLNVWMGKRCYITIRKNRFIRHISKKNNPRIIFFCSQKKNSDGFIAVMNAEKSNPLLGFWEERNGERCRNQNRVQWTSIIIIISFVGMIFHIRFRFICFEYAVVDVKMNERNAKCESKR